MIGGQAGIVGHVHIADGARINAQSGVSKSIKAKGGAVTGSPAYEYTSALRSQAISRNLPELKQKLKELEAPDQTAAGRKGLILAESSDHRAERHIYSSLRPQAIITDPAILRLFIPEIIGEITAPAFVGQLEIPDHRLDAIRIYFLSFAVTQRIDIQLFRGDTVPEKIQLRRIF